VTFIDALRTARVSRVAVLHEFWTQYDPSQARVHLFFEGHDDAVFFRHFVDRYLQPRVRVFIYRCDGKSKVFEAFERIVQRFPGVKSTLFFVDKDLDDILGIPWPTDPRVFVTDVYSIENYLATRTVMQRFFRDAVRMTGVQFDEATIFEHFEAQRTRFNRLMIPLMAWILALRRAGERPNLNNINLGEVCGLTDDCRVHARVGNRVKHLTAACGATKRGHRQIAMVARDLSRMSSDRIVRGKFAAWFLVEFWKRLAKHLEALAREAKGKVVIRPNLERSTLVATLAPYADIPRSLELFLEAHFVRHTAELRANGHMGSFVRRAVDAVARALGFR
jgi:hypothetical protein